MYSIQYERHAKTELEDVKETYGVTFRDEVNWWLAGLASEVERQDHTLAIVAVRMGRLKGTRTAFER